MREVLHHSGIEQPLCPSLCTSLRTGTAVVWYFYVIEDSSGPCVVGLRHSGQFVRALSLAFLTYVSNVTCLPF